MAYKKRHHDEILKLLQLAQDLYREVQGSSHPLPYGICHAADVLQRQVNEVTKAGGTTTALLLAISE